MKRTPLTLPFLSIHSLDTLPLPIVPHKAERLQAVEVILFKEGNAMLAMDTQYHTLRGGSIYCLMPGQMHLLKVNGNAQGYLLRIDPASLREADDEFDISLMINYTGHDKTPMVESSVASLAKLEHLITVMWQEFESDGTMATEIVKGYLRIFVMHLARELNVRRLQDGLGQNIEILRKFVALLHQHISSKKLVADYADELCITPNYLNYVVKKLTGHTASHYIQQHIVTEAKRKAMHSQLRMKQIANELGFDDHAHFSKFFKNYSGVNFSKYRKSLLAGA